MRHVATYATIYAAIRRIKAKWSVNHCHSLEWCEDELYNLIMQAEWFVWRHYAIYYHQIQKQFIKFFIHKIWTPLCTIISFPSVINAITNGMYTKELAKLTSLCTINAKIKLHVITLVNATSLNIIHSVQFLLVWTTCFHFPAMSEFFHS